MNYSIVSQREVKYNNEKPLYTYLEYGMIHVLNFLTTRGQDDWCDYHLNMSEETFKKVIDSITIPLYLNKNFPEFDYKSEILQSQIIPLNGRQYPVFYEDMDGINIIASLNAQRLQGMSLNTIPILYLLDIKL